MIRNRVRPARIRTGRHFIGPTDAERNASTDIDAESDIPARQKREDERLQN
jgi:hypothetical protein